MRAVNDVKAPEPFRKKICNLRSGDYYSLIEEIQRELMTEKTKQKLKISNTLDNAYIEALIIYATRKQYADTIKADVVLMALGLLKTMYHHNIQNTKSKKEAIAQCRIEFLNKSTYVEEDYESTKYHITSYEDAERQGLTQVLVDALKAAEARYINKVADKLYANYVDYLSDILKNKKKFIMTLEGKATPLLPELKNRRENPNAPSPSDPPPDIPIPQRDINAIKQYIKAIQTSSDYDEYGDELYEALCGPGNPPYSKWVATWLIKCIRESFGESIDANILYASFALFKGYELGMMDINARLNKYCRESNYLDNSSYFFEKLIKRSNLKKKLREYEQGLTNSLIEYIMGIPTPKEHIASLNGFGEKIMIPNGRICYKPIRPEIKYTDKFKPSFNIKRFINVVIVIIVIVLLIAIPNYITINNNTINNSPDRKPYIQAALPMVKSLQATKDTIYIKAGERRLLSVDVEPNDAAKFLYYGSDKEYLVVISDDGVIQAATDWSEDTVPEADIYIHAKNKIAKIHVIVYK